MTHDCFRALTKSQTLAGPQSVIDANFAQLSLSINQTRITTVS